MNTTISGVVKDGLIVPEAPLPEGARVEIRLAEVTLSVPPDLQEELEAWQQAGAESIEMIERLAQESEAPEKR